MELQTFRPLVLANSTLSTLLYEKLLYLQLQKTCEIFGRIALHGRAEKQY
jgi:hypothetical protein